MNVVLFEPEEVGRPLARSDARAVHILEVLRRGAGDELDAGLVNGPMARATLTAVNQREICLTFKWGNPPPPLDPITLIVGMPRPQTARKVLEEATSLGVAALHFVAAGKAEGGYGRSKLWSSGEWRRHLIAGASQAFTTRIPSVVWGDTLESTLGSQPAVGTRLALDNYEYADALSRVDVHAPVVLCIGAERGWSGRERDLLRASGFTLVHAGPRVLRVETVCVVALALVRSRLGLM